ncbi:hypothetical protein [Roseibacillus persicicus]|uniref:hypothetical protein n=1 Tax=Roseibacillus persicicus TaxID=454148 RepID=UPI00281041D4|nr:hypothetical protein [Roseibacillus persicicus]MDQ8192630.1 hypothetical protein [Roseibacillus persicicus]
MELFLSCSTFLGYGRDVLEDAVEEYLGSKAEVTGGGAGNRGWNVDIDVVREIDECELRDFCRFLIGFGVAPHALLELYSDGVPKRRLVIGEFSDLGSSE